MTWFLIPELVKVYSLSSISQEFAYGRSLYFRSFLSWPFSLQRPAGICSHLQAAWRPAEEAHLVSGESAWWGPTLTGPCFVGLLTSRFHCVLTQGPLVEENRGDWWYVGRTPQASLPPHPSPSLGQPCVRYRGKLPGFDAPELQGSAWGTVRVSHGNGKVDLKAVQLSEESNG